MEQFSTEYLAAVSERFWDKVEIGEGCWFWKAAIRKLDGVGVFGLDKKILYAHRLAYFLSRGTVPEGVEIRRTCGKVLCVRPSHLELRLSPYSARDLATRGLVM